MNTKIVYVLTSSEKDVYYEQTLISVFSLRLHNKDAECILFTDTDTAASFVGKRKEVHKYFKKITAIDTPPNFNNLRKSRYIKTMIRQIVDGDFLFIDSDTVITSTLSDIDNINYEMAGVPDRHVLIKDHPMINVIQKQVAKTGYDIDINRYYINSGVLYVKDTPLTHRIYQLWHQKWLELEQFQTVDQPPLAWVDNHLGHPINLLDGIWNCQIIDGGLRYLLSSKIIHYFASSKNSKGQAPYLLYDNALYCQIKEKGIITEEIETIISNPLTAFLPVCKIITGDDILYLNSELHRIVYKEYHSLYSIVESVSVLFMKFIRKLKRIHHA